MSITPLSIKSSEKEENDYLETLLINTDKHHYLFVIWWAYRDYDALRDTFTGDVNRG